MRYVYKLPLADLKFNLPVKIDFLLHSDVIEEVRYHIRIKGNGLSISDSMFGGMVSGPVNIVSTHVALGADTEKLPHLESHQFLGARKCTRDKASDYV